MIDYHPGSVYQSHPYSHCHNIITWQLSIFFTCPVINGLKKQCGEDEENQVERPRPIQGDDPITETCLQSLQERESIWQFQ